MVHLDEAGIIQRISNLLTPRVLPRETTDPIALSFGQLVIWFRLWFGLLLIAVVVFMVEVLRGKMRRRALKVHEKVRNRQKL
jgi:hypothetical protein